MRFPIGFGDGAQGLICGLVLGSVQERVVFGSATKLKEKLRFKKWAGFNARFTAIIVAAVGLYELQLVG